MSNVLLFINNMFSPKWNLWRIGRRATPDKATVVAMRLELQKAGYLPHRSSWALLHARTAAVISTVLAMSIVGATGTYAYVSDTVLPDQPLYSVRQGIENVQIALAVTAEQKARLHQQQILRRMHEAALMQKQKRVIPPQHAQTFLNALREVETASTTVVMTDPMTREERQALRAQLRAQLRVERAQKYAAQLKVRAAADASSTEQDLNDDDRSVNDDGQGETAAGVTASSTISVPSSIVVSSTASTYDDHDETSAASSSHVEARIHRATGGTRLRLHGSMTTTTTGRLLNLFDK